MKTLRPLIPLLSLFILGFASSAYALMINWTDWQSSTATNGFTATGTITSGAEVITVTYNNPNGINFFQTGTGTDYWRQGFFGALGRDPDTSPYTSTGPNGVDNIPTASEMISLRNAGTQTLTFSQAIANPVFSYVSLNINGYGFDQDFDILSFGGPGGDIDGSGANDIGDWGVGTSSKNIVTDMLGNTEYQLIGTGEPHGSLRFTGTFDTVSWRSLSSENWNGFTVGVQGTATQVFPCQVNPNLPQCNPNPNAIPEPTTLALMGLGIAGLGFRRKTH